MHALHGRRHRASRRPLAAAAGGLALAVTLAACGTSQRQERVFNVPPPSDKPAAPVESRVPRPSPAALAAVSAVVVPRADRGRDAGTEKPERAAPAPAPAAAPAPKPPPEAPRSFAAPPAGLPAALYFDFDHYRVRPKDRELLQRHAAALKANPGLVLLLRGHADGQGPAEYNQALAEKRAEMAARELVAMGVDLQQLRHEAAPLPPAGAAPARTQPADRRVELVYLVPGAVAGR